MTISAVNGISFGNSHQKTKGTNNSSVFKKGPLLMQPGPNMKTAKTISNPLRRIAFKAFMGLGLIGLATGCIDNHIPDVKPNQTPLEKNFPIMASRVWGVPEADANKLDSVAVLDDDTRTYKFLPEKSTRDEYVFRTSGVMGDGSVHDFGESHFKYEDGIMKEETHMGGKFNDPDLKYIGDIEYSPKDTKSVIARARLDEIKYTKLEEAGQVLKQSMDFDDAGTIVKNVFKSVRK